MADKLMHTPPKLRRLKLINALVLNIFKLSLGIEVFATGYQTLARFVL
jgi:hypothetical protein